MSTWHLRIRLVSFNQSLSQHHPNVQHTITMSDPVFVTKDGQEYTEPMLFVQLMQRVSKLEEQIALHNKVMRQILETLDTHEHVQRRTEHPNYW